MHNEANAIFKMKKLEWNPASKMPPISFRYHTSREIFSSRSELVVDGACVRSSEQDEGQNLDEEHQHGYWMAVTAEVSSGILNDACCAVGHKCCAHEIKEQKADSVSETHGHSGYLGITRQSGSRLLTKKVAVKKAAVGLGSSTSDHYDL